MSDVGATRRRAEVRGREAVARWRIQTGTWAGRALAALTAAPVLFAFLDRGGPPWTAVAAQLLVAGLVLAAAERVRRGDRWAAVALLVYFVLEKVGRAVAGTEPLWNGALVAAILAFCLAQGVWGTFALARVRRDAAAVPPAPARVPPNEASQPTSAPDS